MIRTLHLLSLVAAMSLSAVAADEPSKGIEPEKIDLGRPVSFEKDIRDILDLNCVACHNLADAESRLNVENVDSLLKGGKRGTAIVPGKPDESLLYLAAARKKQPHMPPLPNKVEASALTPKELGLLRQWIIEGAKSDSTGGGTIVKWQPVPEGMKATYAIALSPWADRVAASRANQISVFDIGSGAEVKLLDPALADVKLEDQVMYPTGAAHRDFVHALAFHPNGRMVASAGFRVVKLWEQSANVQTLKTGLGAVAADADVQAEKGLVVFGTKQNSISVRSLSDGKEIKKLDGHTASVNGVAFSPDGTQVVSGSADKTFRVWSLESGQVVRQLETPAPIHDLCLTPDGSHIITVHEDKLIRVWTTAAAETPPAEGETEKPVKEIAGHGNIVTSISLVGDQQFVTGSTDNTARIWNLANWAAVRSLNHGGPVVSVAGGPDGKAIISGSSNNTAKLWNAANGQQIAELRGHLPAQRGETLAKEEADLAKQLVALGKVAEDAAVKNEKERADALKKAMDAKTAAEKAVSEQKPKQAEAKKKNDEAKAVAEAAQKKADDAKKALDAKTDDADLKKASDAAAAEAKKATAALKAPGDAFKKEDDELKKREEAQKSAIRSLELGTKADVKAKKQLEEAKAHHLKVQELQKAEDAKSKKATEDKTAAEKPLTAVAFSADSSRVATAADDGTITIWSAGNGKPLDILTGAAGPISVLEFSDAKHLISAGEDQNAVVWDAAPEWKLAATLGAKSDDPMDLTESPFVFRVISLDFSPDGKQLATGGGDPSRSGELMIWDVEKRALVKTIEDAHSDTIFGLQFSRDGKQIVSGAADKFVKIHEIGSGAHVRSFEGHTHHVLDASWKADGSQIVSAGADNAIKVWNVSTGEQVRTITNYAKQVTSIRFVGVSGNVISCGGDKTVRFHTAANGSNFRSFSGGTDYMYAADSARDQTVVVAGGEDGVIRVWNGANGQVIKAFEPPAPAEETTQASVTE
jgi:WD40 repeat protein